MKILQARSSFKLYRTSSCVGWLNGEKPNVTGTVSVLAIREMSTSDIRI